MINKFGLYKNKIERYEILGLKSSILDPQSYGFWIPLFDSEGNIHLVDTYYLDESIAKDYNNNVRLAIVNINRDNKDMSRFINKANNDYYYGGSIKINNINERYFEEICDLREYARIDQKTAMEKFNKEDYITNVFLCHEHAYPHGICLLRLDAQEKKEKEEKEEQNRENNESSKKSKILDNIKPYKYEDLKEGMAVYVRKIKRNCIITALYKDSNYIGLLFYDFWGYCPEEFGISIKNIEEYGFYPPNIEEYESKYYNGDLK